MDYVITTSDEPVAAMDSDVHPGGLSCDRVFIDEPTPGVFIATVAYQWGD